MNNYIKASIGVLIIVLISAFIPYTKSYETNINISILDVANQINNPNNWKNWYLPFKKAFKNDSSKYQISENFKENKFAFTVNGELTHVNLFGPTLLVINLENDANTSVVLKAIFTKNDKVKVVQLLKTSFLNYCWLSLTNKKSTYNFAQNLKNYYDTPSLYYGFKIVKTGVADTDFVTTNKTVIKEKTFTVADSLQKTLFAYAKRNNLKCRNFPFLVITNVSSDSVIVTSMLVIIDKKVKLNSEVAYLQMPKNGNMLIGYYKGEYRKRGQIYSSMDKYVTRYGLTKVVSAFEKFLDNKLPKNDSSYVDMALYYPIY
ncbi:MAG: hypothetical protein EAZ15_09225 [Sphingobacteriales bacterium]|nr:MAG: hypothetical protein EAZ15_09225 [Sphingobacteriales bacterium]